LYSQRRMVRQALKLGLLVTLVVLVLSACGGGGDESAKARKIPEDKDATLPAGKYVSEEFKPAVSFRLDEGWNTPLETADILSLSAPKSFGPYAYFEFWVIHKVNKVVSSYEVKAKPPPDDMVAWLQNHPYLDTEKPKPITVAGEKGMQIEAVASRVPQDYYGSFCDDPCLPLFKSTYNPFFNTFTLYKGDKVRFIELADVEGKTVTITITAPGAKFDELLPKAQKVLDTVEWKGE
jgi:hypothetical protein